MGTSATPAIPAAPVREQVFLDQVGDDLEAQRKAAEKEATDAEATRKAEIEARARAAAQGESPDAIRAKALEDALRISEEARKKLDEVLQGRQRETAPPPLEDKTLTDEEYNELYQKDPMKAIGLKVEQGLKVIAKNFDARINSLVSSTASSAREAAERKYPDEFKVLGKEIADFVATVPQADARLASAKSWDDLVDYIRGKHFVKFRDALAEKDKTKAAEDAQQRERAAAGAHTRSATRAQTPLEESEVLDETEKKIAETLMAAAGVVGPKAHEEYKVWKKAGRAG